MKVFQSDELSTTLIITRHEWIPSVKRTLWEPENRVPEHSRLMYLGHFCHPRTSSQHRSRYMIWHQSVAFGNVPDPRLLNRHWILHSVDAKIRPSLQIRTVFTTFPSTRDGLKKKQYRDRLNNRTDVQIYDTYFGFLQCAHMRYMCSWHHICMVFSCNTYQINKLLDPKIWVCDLSFRGKAVEIYTKLQTRIGRFENRIETKRTRRHFVISFH